MKDKEAINIFICVFTPLSLFFRTSVWVDDYSDAEAEPTSCLLGTSFVFICVFVYAYVSVCMCV